MSKPHFEALVFARNPIIIPSFLEIFVTCFSFSLFLFQFLWTFIFLNLEVFGLFFLVYFHKWSLFLTRITAFHSSTCEPVNSPPPGIRCHPPENPDIDFLCVAFDGHLLQAIQYLSIIDCASQKSFSFTVWFMCFTSPIANPSINI